MLRGLGAGRLLAGIETKGEKREAVYTDAIEALLRSSGAESACVLYSGDTGFNSGARLLLPMGLCFLPAFLCIAVVPTIMSFVQG